MGRYTFLLLFLITSLHTYGQVESVETLKNLRSQLIKPALDTIVLDSLSILPESFVATRIGDQQKLNEDKYHLDWAQALLIIKDSSLLNQEIQLVYRVFPYKIERIAFHKSQDKIVPYNVDSNYFNPYYYNPTVNANDANTIEWGQLDYSGSFARGVSFGSSQSLALNSELDLQLTGFIGKDIEVTAALSDNNIPIQPDGNTAQVQDFDQVYIKLRKDKHEAIAGDYQIKEDQSYFMRYNKQLQGASYSGEFDIMKDLSLASSVSFSIAKGKFTRNTILGQEGNQGPYRLVGLNGETFIIILAGSEKVFIDNILMKRGRDNDYTMDYNAGELSFTPNQLITKDTRIVVEFEYADRSYFRSFIQTRHKLTYKKVETSFKFYNEQDNKNNPINVSLDEDERNLLRNIGDDLDQAFISGINQVEFDQNRVLYKIKDSVVNTVVYDSVFVNSTNSDSAIFSLSFSYVGPGNGFYEPGISSANGRVFNWVAPDINGNPTGSYDPKILLITPKKTQLMTLGVSSEINENWTVSAEGAMSNKDINTFSDLGNKDDRDFAGQANIQYKSKIGKNKLWTTRNKVGYEFRADNFTPIESYRPIEFQRDWNVGIADSSTNEHFVFAETNFNNKFITANYRFSNYNRGDIYQGYNNYLGIRIKKKGWLFTTYSSILNTQQTALQSTFRRPNFELEKNFNFFKGIAIGVKGMQEHNRIVNIDNDSLNAASFVFNIIGGFIRSSDSSKVNWRLSYDRRLDKGVSNAEFKTVSLANTVQFSGDVKALKAQRLAWKFSYRNLVVKDTLLTATQSDNNILGRLEYGFKIKKGVVRFDTKYELGSGQERQRNFTYLRVQNGDGIYSWIDQNQDDAQQQNEFVISEFSDSANFIRVFSNFNEFVQTNVTQFDQSIQINPKIVWSKEKGLKGFIAKLNIQSSMLISKRSLKEAKGQSFNPFSLASNSENIIAVNANIRNALYFNRSSSIYKISYIQNWSQNKLLLLNGIDTRQTSSHQLKTTWNVKKFLSLNIEGTVDHRTFIAQFFDVSNFDIRKYAAQIGSEYIWKTKLRTRLHYNYSLRNNLPEFGGEQANAHEVAWNFKFSLVGKSTVVADFKYVNITYNGEANSTKTYEILNGLRAGQNFLWSVRLDQKLVRNIQLTLQYDGRKTGESKLVNTGTASVRALF